MTRPRFACGCGSTSFDVGVCTACGGYDRRLKQRWTSEDRAALDAANDGKPFNTERAEAAEAEVARLRAAVGS